MKLAVLVLVAALVAAVAPALAKRGPNRTERKAITTAVKRYIRASNSAAAPDSKIRKIAVSTADRRYALVTLSSTSAGPARALLHKGAIAKKKAKKKSKPGAWRVIDYGSGAFSCSDAPGRVFRDLLGSSGACAPQGY